MKELKIKNDGLVLLDDEDYAKFSHLPWYKDRAGYAICWRPDKKDFLRLHNEILLYWGPDDIDHIDRNKLNNQRVNLRIVPHFVNLHNSKIRTDNTNGFKGVFLNRSNTWGYQVWLQGNKFSKQGFPSAEEAAKARALFLQGKI